MVALLQGLKYPDEYFVRFFFKNGLDTKKLSYVEFGCGNGNNLLLPYSYHNNVIGIDVDKNVLAKAQANFSLFESQGSCKLIQDDMIQFVQKNRELYCDVLLLPNIVNYLSYEKFQEFLYLAKQNALYKQDAYFFIRFRSPKDFRYGFGERIDTKSYRVVDAMTGEKGCINTFYTASEMIDLLREFLQLQEYKVFHIDFENEVKNGDVIFNSDVVIWGRIG